MRAIKEFFETEAKEKKWELFNYLFVRKAIDMSFDFDGNEREGCS